MKFRLFGERVLLEYVPPKQGTLWVPEDKNSMYKMGRIVAIADGIRPGLPDKAIFLKEGEIVFFQTNAVQQAQSMFQKDKNTVYINLLQSEIIARVDDNDISRAKFHVVGDWILLQPYIKDQSIIHIPDSHKEALAINYRVEEAGHTVDLEIKPGVEIVLTHGMAHGLRLGKDEVAYVHKNYVHGVVVVEEDGDSRSL